MRRTVSASLQRCLATIGRAHSDGKVFPLARDAQVKHSGFNHIEDVARVWHRGKQRAHVVSIDEHASDFDESIEKAGLRRLFPWSLQQVVLGVRMRIMRERADELACCDETL